MLKPPLPKEPAWKGLIPTEPRYQLVTHAFSHTILTAAGLTGELHQQAGTNEQLAGLYKFIPENRQKPLFIKVIQNDQFEIQQRSQKIEQHLLKHRISTNQLCNDYPKAVGKDHFMLAYPFVVGRFCRPGHKQDYALAGELLGKVHLALKDIPEQDVFKQAQNHRYTQILAGQDLIAHSTFTAPIPTIIDIISNTDISFDFLQGKKQVIHGDINLGNILFAQSTNQSIILDFEDCTLSWLNPWIDIAMFIERFILIHTNDPETRTDCVTEFFHHYAAINARIPTIHADELSQILKTLSARALCLLSNMQHQGSDISDCEWEKFVTLYQLADSNPEIFRTITQCLP